MAQVQWATGGIKPSPQPQTGGVKPLPNAQNQPQTAAPKQWWETYAGNLNGQPWAPPGTSGSAATPTGGVEPSPWATPQVQTATPLASAPTQGTGVSTGFQGSPTKWGYNFNSAGGFQSPGMPQTGGIKPQQEPPPPTAPTGAPLPVTPFGGVPAGPNKTSLNPQEPGSMTDQLYRRLSMAGINPDEIWGNDPGLDARLLKVGIDRQTLDEMKKRGMLRPQTGGIKPAQGTAGAAMRIDPNTGEPIKPTPWFGGGEDPPGPIGPGGGPGTENPNSGGPGAEPPGTGTPSTPACKPGEVETSLDANGKLIPNGYECVSSEESWRRQSIYSNVPPGTPAPTPQNSGSPTPTSNSGGGGPRNTTAFPTIPEWTPNAAPEFNGPKWNAPEPFKAPTFNWNKELQAPEFTFNEGFNAPEFEFNGQFQAPTWNSPEAFQDPELQFNEQWKAPSFEEAMSDPGYQFRLKEGLRAMQNNAAAKGKLRTGATIKGLSDYAAESASQEYQNSYNRALEGYNTRLDTAKTKYGAAFQGAEANFDKGMERERARYGAEFEGREAEFDRAFDVAKTKYGAKYQKAFDTYAQKYDLAKTKYGADYERAKDTYQSAFESFIAAFAANYQGKKDEYDSAFNTAKEDFDTKFATAQAEFAPKMTQWQTEQSARQRQWEQNFAAQLERWKWNNPSANTIFAAGL